MSKLTNMVYFITFALLIFHMAGLMDTSIAGVTLSFLMNPQRLVDSSFWSIIKTAIGFVAAAGAVIGLLGGSKISLVVKAGIMSGLVLVIGSELVALWSELRLVDPYFATLIISPMLIVYLLAAMEWWQ